MEDPNKATNQTPPPPMNLYEWQQLQLEAIRQHRLRICAKICEFMEAETGKVYTLEDDLEHILVHDFTEGQRQNVYAKLELLQQFPTQLDTDLPKQ